MRQQAIEERKNLVHHRDFATVVDPRGSLSDFFASLPRILAAEELREAIKATARSLRNGRPVLVALGGHVVKVGTSPLIIDLMERGCIQGVVLNGATAIHDFEIALIGATSEDVATHVADGSFGMARETAEALGESAVRGARGAGLGRALGDLIEERRLPHADLSILAAASRLGVPATVHVAIGTDIVHMHPEVGGAATGEATHLDFRILTSLMLEMEGGTWINVGSAVVLPEVFLKAINLARNAGRSLGGITAINFDMQSHYRTSVNVLRRPVERGISILGHHEINLPLFRVGLLLEREQDPARERSP